MIGLFEFRSIIHLLLRRHQPVLGGPRADDLNSYLLGSGIHATRTRPVNGTLSLPLRSASRRPSTVAFAEPFGVNHRKYVDEDVMRRNTTTSPNKSMNQDSLPLPNIFCSTPSVGPANYRAWSHEENVAPFA